MPTANRLRQWIREGAGLFVWTFVFFYSQASLVILSLVPASFRVIQMWNKLQTPVWMEGVVELSRVILFVLILSRLEKTGVRQLFRKEFWTDFNTRFAAHIKRNWPHVFIAQIVAFAVLMYGLMNMLINALVNEWTVQAVMDVVGIGHYEDEAAADSVLFFLKNMSIIPMTMVYIARMCGFGTKGKRA